MRRYLANMVASIAFSTAMLTSITTANAVQPLALASTGQGQCLSVCSDWMTRLPIMMSAPLPETLRTGWVFARNLMKPLRQEASLVPVSIPAARPEIRPTKRNDDDAVFGSVALPFKKLGAVAKAQPTFDAIAAGTALTCDQKACATQTKALDVTLASVRQSSLRDKLNAVNVSVNRAIRYTKDSDNYHEPDHWASPAETMMRQKGDCEDYALLKMAALAEEGIALKDMSIVVLYDTKRHFYHAVLSVKVQDRFYILDNMRDQVLLDRDLPDYQPLFSISEGRGYLHGSRVKSQAVAAIKRFDLVTPGEGADL